MEDEDVRSWPQPLAFSSFSALIHSPEVLERFAVLDSGLLCLKKYLKYLKKFKLLKSSTANNSARSHDKSSGPGGFSGSTLWTYMLKVEFKEL